MPRFCKLTQPRLLMASLPLCLAACASPPAYERPTLPMPSTWSAAPSAAATLKASDLAWQNYYTDPRLQALINQALQYNRDLVIATARVSEARAQYGIQKEGNWPTVNLSGGYSRSQRAVDNDGGGQGGGGSRDSQKFEVQVGTSAYEIDFWGRIASLNQQAKAEYLASEAAQQAFRLSLIGDVANAYWNLLELSGRVHLLQQLVSTRKTDVEISRRRFELGEINALDFNYVEAALQKSLMDQAAAEQSYQQTYNWLGMLTGTLLAANGANLPQGYSLLDQKLSADWLAEMPSEVLLKRPDVMAAEYKLQSAHANIEAIRTAFLPRLTLTTNIGTSSAALSGLFGAGTGAWLFSPLITYPLFTGDRKEQSLTVAEARRDIAIAEYEKTLLNSFREVADLLVAREQLQKQLTAQQNSWELAQQRLQLTQARYRAGLLSKLDLLEAERDHHLAQLNLLQTNKAWLVMASQLYKALAGGAK